ncbi:hypothetical protein [Dyadobacter sp. OTU695]
MDTLQDKKTLEAVLKLHELTLEDPSLLPEQVKWLEDEIKQVKTKLKKAK